MKRVPISRSTTPMKRGKGVNRVSDKRKRDNKVRFEVVPLLDYCEAKRAGAPGACFGPLNRHEILPSGRGGSRTDPKNSKTVCNWHNSQLSQDVAIMRWGYANGFLKHSWD